MTERKRTDIDAEFQRQVELRTQIITTCRTQWTCQEWIDDARQIMDAEGGASTLLLDGHVLALLAHATGVEERVDEGYRAGFAAGRADFRKAAVAAIDSLMIGPP